MGTKPLTLTDIKKRAAQFVAEWRDEEGYERGQGQSFVRDLLSVYGIRRTKAAQYEARARRASTGRQGYIDALISGLAMIEMKSKGEDLSAAEAQAVDYLEDLTPAEAPRYIITSDFARFRLLDLGEEKQPVIEFEIDELVSNPESFAFLAGYQKRDFGSREQESASIKAAHLMADLYEELEKTGYPVHEASVFLVRTLFCLYADDSGLWERDIFAEYLENRTSEDGSDLGPQLTALYQDLNKPKHLRYSRGDELLDRFEYVNGSVFGEPTSIPHFDRVMRDKLLQAVNFNWGEISPAIFGSLFQAVRSSEARREMGVSQRNCCFNV